MGWTSRVRKAPGAATQAWSIASGGGPTRLRVRGVSRPSGLIFPVSRLRLEIEARNGATARWEPPIPLPFSYVWAYRIARRLKVPVIAGRDPENLTFSIRLPRAPRRR